MKNNALNLKDYYYFNEHRIDSGRDGKPPMFWWFVCGDALAVDDLIAAFIEAYGGDPSAYRPYQYHAVSAPGFNEWKQTMLADWRNKRAAAADSRQSAT